MKTTKNIIKEIELIEKQILLKILDNLKECETEPPGVLEAIITNFIELNKKYNIYKSDPKINKYIKKKLNKSLEAYKTKITQILEDFN